MLKNRSLLACLFILFSFTAHSQYTGTGSVTQGSATTTTTGLIGPEVPDFKLYPNPIPDHITLEFDKPLVDGTVRIYDAMGRIVLSS